MTGWCPHKEGDLRDLECHFDGYCTECPHHKGNKKVNKNLTVGMLEDILSEIEDKDMNIIIDSNIDYCGYADKVEIEDTYICISGDLKKVF